MQYGQYIENRVSAYLHDFVSHACGSGTGRSKWHDMGADYCQRHELCRLFLFRQDCPGHVSCPANYARAASAGLQRGGASDPAHRLAHAKDLPDPNTLSQCFCYRPQPQARVSGGDAGPPGIVGR